MLPASWQSTDKGSDGIADIARPAVGFGSGQDRFSLNYSDMLVNAGFGNSELVCRAVESWIAIFEELSPRLVVAEHAPTAMLAARFAGIPLAIIGTGFTVPPLANPMPGIHPWIDIPRAELAAADKRLMEAVAPVFARYGRPSPGQVADLFEGVRRYRCTLPALDHYQPTADENYWGLVLGGPKEDGLVRATGAPTLFAYLRWMNRATRPVLDALEHIGQPALAIVPDLPAGEERTRSNLVLARDLVDLDQIALRCRLAITEGSFNSTAQFLVGGVPVLCMSRQLEQACLSYRLSNRGLARSVSFLTPLPDMRGLIENCLDDGAEHDAVRQLRSDASNRRTTACRIAADLAS